jgi:hypothetical protein
MGALSIEKPLDYCQCNFRVLDGLVTQWRDFIVETPKHEEVRPPADRGERQLGQCGCEMRRAENPNRARVCYLR